MAPRRPIPPRRRAFIAGRPLFPAVGVVLGRTTYDAYGNERSFRPDDWDHDGDVDTDDFDAFFAAYTAQEPAADLDRDGDIDGADLTAYFGIVPPSPSFANPVGYCGYLRSGTSGLWAVRFRHLDSRIGRWVQRDPLGYVDGMNLYEYCLGHPVSLADPEGLRTYRVSHDSGEKLEAALSAVYQTYKIYRFLETPLRWMPGVKPFFELDRPEAKGRISGVAEFHDETGEICSWELTANFIASAGARGGVRLGYAAVVSGELGLDFSGQVTLVAAVTWNREDGVDAEGRLNADVSLQIYIALGSPFVRARGGSGAKFEFRGIIDRNAVAAWTWEFGGIATVAVDVRRITGGWKTVWDQEFSLATVGRGSGKYDLKPDLWDAVNAAKP